MNKPDSPDDGSADDSSTVRAKPKLIVISVTAVLLAAISIGYFLLNDEIRDAIHVSLVLAWILLPPIWFLVERWHPDCFYEVAPSDLKAGQDNVQRCWAAVVAALIFLVPKANPCPVPCCP